MNTTPGAMATGDVWCKDDITDIIRTVKQQQDRRKKLRAAESLRKSGLTLLTAAQAQSGSSDAWNGDVPRDILKELDQFKGVKRLSFVKKEDLEDIVRYDNLPAKTKKDSKTGGPTTNEGIDADTKSLLEKKRLGIKPTKYDDIFLEYPYRPITELSTYTNMRYMMVSNSGLISLSHALRDDDLINRICLANARISCLSIDAFCLAIVSMPKLCYLNLSGNAIADKGAERLAAALPLCKALKELNVSFNRIGFKG